MHSNDREIEDWGSAWLIPLVEDPFTFKDIIASQGNRYEFRALFDTDGNLVPAKRVRTLAGFAWMILPDPDDPAGPAVGLVHEPVAGRKDTRARRLAQRGYCIGWVLAPAKVKTERSGTGFSGWRSTHHYVARTDGGFSPDVEVLRTNCQKCSSPHTRRS